MLGYKLGDIPHLVVDDDPTVRSFIVRRNLPGGDEVFGILLHIEENKTF
jgi:hypothetical protein